MPDTYRRIPILVLVFALAACAQPPTAAQDAPPTNRGATAPPATPIADAPAPEPTDPAPPITDPQQQINALANVYKLLRDNKPQEAAHAAAELLARLPQPSVARTGAYLALGEMTGLGHARRQSYWLNRDVIDAVVLVPDEAAFLRAVAAWTDTTFFPVLIEDAWYTTLFIRAFQPSAVYRWTPPATASDETTVRSELAALIRAQNNRLAPATDTPAAREDAPDAAATAPTLDVPGIVVIDPNGPLRAAGIALALGRNQPLFVFTPQHDHTHVAAEPDIRRLNDSIIGAMAAYRLFDGPALATITLAADTPYRYDAGLGPRRPYAADDLLGRVPNLMRVAAVGRLSGTPTRSVYQAMCSLFLQPRSAMLYNTYAARPNGSRGEYHLTDVAQTLDPRMRVFIRQARDTTVANFVADTQPRFAHDLLWINSSNGGGALNLAGSRLLRVDMPLGRAHIAYIVASFSAADPWRNETIAAQSLANGAYWYFGSVHEPYLEAFVQSNEFVLRAAPPTPLAVAARQLPGHEYYKPWRLMLIGDPLLSLRNRPATRIDAPPPLSGAARLEPPDPAAPADADEPAARLRLAAFTGAPPDVLDAAAARALPLHERLSPDELALLAETIYTSDDPDRLLSLVPRHAARHPVAQMLHLRALRALFDRALAAGEPQNATHLLRPMLEAINQPIFARETLTRYILAMDAAGRRDDALGQLAELRRLDWPRNIEQVLTTLAEDPPAPAQPPAP